MEKVEANPTGITESPDDCRFEAPNSGIPVGRGLYMEVSACHEGGQLMDTHRRREANSQTPRRYC